MKITNQAPSRYVRDRGEPRTLNIAPEADPWYGIRLPRDRRGSVVGRTVRNIIRGIPRNDRPADLRGRGRGDE